MHRRALMLELERSVETKTGLRCTEITDKGVVTVDRDGKAALFEADTIIVAVGYRARTGLVDSLRAEAPEFIAIGDCLKAGRVLQAVRTGYDAGMAI
jgi:hypothetical protein